MLLGLDGATYRILQPMLDAGLLPNTEKLFAHGVHGILYSTAAFSPISWNSILTGMDRDRHGIRNFNLAREMGVSFTQPMRDDKRTYNTASFDRTATPIWRILSDAGKRVGLIGFLTTYPAEEINGAFISGDLTPNLLINHTRKYFLKRDPNSRNSYQGTIFGSELRLERGEDGSWRIRYQEDSETDFGNLFPEQSSWLHIRLDGDLRSFFLTEASILPTLEAADWTSTPASHIPPLQAILPSGVSPKAAMFRKNRPLFLYIDGDGPGERYNRVRFAYQPDVERLRAIVDIYGVPVAGRVISSGDSPRDTGEIELVPQIRGGESLSIRWKADDNGGQRTLSLTFADQEAEGAGSWDIFIDWIRRNRCRKYNSATAFLGLTYAHLSSGDDTLSIELHGLHDSFTRPAYHFFHPENLFAKSDFSSLPTDGSLEMYRNHKLKKWLFDQVFNPADFDFFGICFTATDKVQHKQWNSPDPLDFDLSFHNQEIIDRWLEIDRYIGDILPQLGPEWAVVVCSDHGFSRVFNRRQILFNWNQLLQDIGLLEVRNPEPPNLTTAKFQPARQQAWQVETIFHCLQTPTSSLSGFFVLENSEGGMATRIVCYPGCGSYPTSLWQSDAVVRSRRELRFEETVPAGRYRLLYQPSERGVVGSRRIFLGNIEIPESPPSLITPHSLRRIGDVEVLPAKEARRILSSTKPVAVTSDIEFLSATITPVQTRYLGFLRSSADRVIHETSRAIYYTGHDLEGSHIMYDGIYLLGEPQTGEKQLLQDLKNLISSIHITGTDTFLFFGARVDHSNRYIRWKQHRNILGPEIVTNRIAHCCYDATQSITYSFRGQEFSRPLGELVHNLCIGSHENEGLYAVLGQNIPDLGVTEQAIEHDITPTILHLLGVDIPQGLNGKPIPFTLLLPNQNALHQPVTNEDELYEKLKSIGYLDGL